MVIQVKHLFDLGDLKGKNLKINRYGATFWVLWGRVGDSKEGEWVIF